MKYLCLVFACMGLSAVAYSQPGHRFFVKAALGYDAPLNSAQQVQMSGFPYTGSTIALRDDYVFDADRASYGAGSSLHLAGGYWLSRHVGVALDISAGFSNRQYEKSAALGIYPEGTITTIRQYVKMPVMITPSLAMRTSWKDFTCYAMAGAALPVSRHIYTESATRKNDTLLFSDKSSLQTSFSVGLSGTAGLMYQVSGHWSISAELHVLALSVYTKRSELVAAQAYGQDVLDSRTEYEKTTVYNKGYDPYYTYNENAPRPRARYAVPFNSIGVQLGVWYSW